MRTYRRKTERIAPPPMSPPQQEKPPVTAWLEGIFGRRAFPTYRVRLVVQIAFALTCLALGIQFARFLHAAEAGEFPLPARPPGAEGFLPISGLMGLLDALYQGTLNRVHPAATVLFVIFVLVAILARKAFCSWICPVGLTSEALARIGRRIFGRNFRPWLWLDIPLRGLKYLLAGFFLWAIFRMGPEGLRYFIESDYNQVADVKMYLFFAEIGGVSAVILAVLVLLSIPIQGAWCRYLCPYGALLGLVSWISPVKIRRNPQTCTDCGKCDEVCMARLPVSKKLSITSVECTGCLDCVAVCPAGPTLTVGTPRRRLGPLSFAALVVGLFLAGYLGARAFGMWQNEITGQQYHQHLERINDPSYGHPGS